MDDLISRQAAINAIENTECELSKDAWDELTDAIMQLPPAQPTWIPVEMRPMDEEERSYWSDIYGYDIEKEDAVTFDCPMPDDGQEVWICFRNGNVEVDTCGIDEGTYLEGNGDWLDVVAWMPYEKPKPYNGDVTDDR